MNSDNNSQNTDIFMLPQPEDQQRNAAQINKNNADLNNEQIHNNQENNDQINNNQIRNDQIINNQQRNNDDQINNNQQIKFYENLNFVMFLLCMLNIAQCMVVTGQLMLSIPLLEKIFGFKSYQMSFPNICYNIAFGFCSTFIGYKTVNRKIFAIGVGGIILAIGCFLFITPHYISSFRITSDPEHDPNSYGIQTFHTCKWNDTITPPHLNPNDILNNPSNSPSGDALLFWDRHRSSLSLTMFCAAFAIMGIGSSPLHTFTITYLNQVTSDGHAGMYLAIFYVVGAIGPALGFILGKVFLSIHVNWPSKLENHEITPDSENWIGAWWLGFFTGGIAIVVISIVIMLVGLKTKITKKQPSTTKVDIKPTTATTCTVIGVIDSSNNEQMSISGSNRPHSFIVKTSCLFSDYSMMLIFLGLAFDMLPLTAFTSFMTKIITVQFRVNINNASLLTGAVVIPAACFGFVAGSIYNKLVKTPYYKILGLCIISYLTMIFVMGMFVSCPSREIQGVQLNSKRIVTSIDYKGCNMFCNCNYYRYEPVCRGNITYFNPCVIGCTESNAKEPISTFEKCKCFPNNNDDLNPVTDGGCIDTGCKNIYLYLAASAVTLILVLSLGIPFILYSLSVTKDHMKDYSIGFLQTMVRFFVVAGPLLYGFLIDKSCILWLPGKYGEERGNCAEYNNPKMNIAVSSAILCTKLFASACYSLAFVLFLRKCNN